MSTPAPIQPNIRSTLESLLATVSSTGSFATSGTHKSFVVPNIVLNDIPPPSYDKSEATTTTPAAKRPRRAAAASSSSSSSSNSSNSLKLPLDAKSKKAVIAVSRAAGIGGPGAQPGGSVVNPEARVTHQVMPNQFTIENQAEFEANTLQPILAQIARDLGTNTDWVITAELYKFLLYEPGCFFRLHRDSARIPNMFGTLVIQLPSKYTGAQLSIRSPLSNSPEQANNVDMSKKATSQIHYAAFYADCLHEVAELTKGDRCVSERSEL